MNNNFLIKSRLYKVQYKDWEKCADIFSKCFLSDPMMEYVFGKGKLKYKYLIRFYEVVSKSLIQKGILYAISENLEGLIAWQAEGEKGISSYAFIRNGAVKLLFTVGIVFIIRLLKYENYAAKIRNNYIEEPYWYLFILAVSDEYRGKGYANRLMKPYIEYFKMNNINSSLETHKEINVKIYERYGYTLKETSTISQSSIKHYSMVSIITSNR